MKSGNSPGVVYQGEFDQVGIHQRAIYQGGIWPGGNSPVGSTYRGEFDQGEFTGGDWPGGNFASTRGIFLLPCHTFSIVKGTSPLALSV